MSVSPPDNAKAAAAANAASAAEREANRRIADANRQVRQFERESREQIDRIENEHERLREVEQARHQAQLEAERQKAYRAVRELQKQAASEQGRVGRQSESDLATLKTHYRDAIFEENRRGESELDRIKQENARAMSHERRETSSLLDQSRTEQKSQIRGLIEDHDRAKAELTSAQKRDYLEARENTEKAREQARQMFQERHQKLILEQDQVLNELWGTASEKLTELRESTARNLSAYEDRQSDPFYKLVRLDADLEELEDEFVLTARIPEHERRLVSVSVKGDAIVISGTRRNEEKLELPDGGVSGTATFQSYYESYPVSWPVEAKQISKSYDGEYLVVRVPKKDPSRIAPRYQAPRPEKARAERPKFPENLPYAHSPDQKPGESQAATGPRPPRRGSKPLA